MIREKTLEEIAETKLRIFGDLGKPSPRQRLLDAHSSLTTSALALMHQKNNDYANVEDPFENFRMFGSLGILVRMSDKFQRLRNFERRGTFSVPDESLRDTVLDLINYAVIYYAWKEEERAKSDSQVRNQREVAGSKVGYNSEDEDLPGIHPFGSQMAFAGFTADAGTRSDGPLRDAEV